MAQGLTHDEGVVGRRHHRLVLCGIRQHWPLVLRMVLLDVLLVRLLRQRNILLVERLRAVGQHLRLYVRPVLVVVRSLLLIPTCRVLLRAHLLL